VCLQYGVIVGWADDIPSVRPTVRHVGRLGVGALEALGISGNVGALVRTAAVFGVGGIVLLDAEVDVYDRRLIRASRGHLFSLPVVRATTDVFLTFCGQHDLTLLVTNPHASCPVDALAGFQSRLAIAFGNEKEGYSRALLEASTSGLSTRTGCVRA